MALTVIEKHIANKFERQVFGELKGIKSDGFLIPGVKLAGTHPLDVDVLLLLPTRGYVIEAKDRGYAWLEVGLNGADWFSRKVPASGGEPVDKRPIHSDETYLELLERKAKVLKSQISKLHGLSHYRVDTVLVVPNKTILVERSLPDGSKARRLSDLVGCITAECACSSSHGCSMTDLKAALDSLGMPPENLQPGAEVNGYRLRSQREGFREPGCPVDIEVWQATCIEDNQQVELRVYRTISSGEDKSEAADRRLKRKKHTLYTYRDTRIANLKSHFTLKPYGEFLVFIPPRGKTLRQLVNETGPLDLRLAVKLIASVADTVARLHQQGVLHLDIRPEHIFVAERLGLGNVDQHCLTGLTNPRARGNVIYSRTFYANLFDASFVGPALRNPSGKTLADTQFDIFSLGAVLAYCAIGEPDYTRAIESAQSPAGTPNRDLNQVIEWALLPPGASPFNSATKFMKALSTIRL